MKNLLFRFLFLAAVFSAVGNAAGVSLSESDFIERSINFVIFLAVVWYFAFGAIKKIFTSRTEEIAKKFAQVDKQEEVAKEQKKDAEKRLKEAKIKAGELVELAQKEAINIEERQKIALKNELANLEQNFENTKIFEQKKMVKDAINEALAEIEKSKDIALDTADYAKIISKRIA